MQFFTAESFTYIIVYPFIHHQQTIHLIFYNSHALKYQNIGFHCSNYIIF